MAAPVRAGFLLSDSVTGFAVTNMIAAIADGRVAPDASPIFQIRSLLDEARLLALAGSAETARRLGAETIALWQPWIARDPALLRLAVVALLQARGFEMVRRLLMACQGRRVRFQLIESDMSGLDEPIASVADADGSTLYIVHTCLFEHPSCERQIEAWSRRLTSQTLPPPLGRDPANALAPRSAAAPA